MAVCLVVYLGLVLYLILHTWEAAGKSEIGQLHGVESRLPGLRASTTTGCTKHDASLYSTVVMASASAFLHNSESWEAANTHLP